MKQEEIEAIILANVGHLSCKDIEEEFGIPGHIIRAYCKEHNLTLLGPKEINLRFIRDMADKWPIEKIAKKLEVKLSYAIDLATKEGIPFMREEKRPLPVRTKEEPVKELTQQEIDGCYRILAEMISHERKEGKRDLLNKLIAERKIVLDGI